MSKGTYKGVGAASKSAPIVLIILLLILQYSVGTYLWEFLPGAMSDMMDSEILAQRQGKMMAVVIPVLTVFFTFAVIGNLNDDQRGNGILTGLVTLVLFLFVSLVFWLKAKALWFEETYAGKPLTPGAVEAYDRTAVAAKFLLIEWSAALSAFIQLNLALTLAGKVSNVPKAKIPSFKDRFKGAVSKMKPKKGGSKAKDSAGTQERTYTPQRTYRRPSTKEEDTLSGGAVDFDL